MNSSPSSSSLSSPTSRFLIYGGANVSGFPGLLSLTNLLSPPARMISASASKCGDGSRGFCCNAGHRRISNCRIRATVRRVSQSRWMLDHVDGADHQPPRLPQRPHQRFTTPLPSYQPLFSSPEAIASLERTIARHFLRTGQFETAETFINVGT